MLLPDQAGVQAVVKVVVAFFIALQHQIHALLLFVLGRVADCIVLFAAAFLQALHLAEQPFLGDKTKHSLTSFLKIDIKIARHPGGR